MWWIVNNRSFIMDDSMDDIELDIIGHRFYIYVCTYGY